MENNSQIEQKSQELSHALIRVAAYIRKKELKGRIDALSFEFIQNIGQGKVKSAIAALNGVKQLVELGKHLLQIEPINANILLREIESLSRQLRALATVLPLPDLEQLFTADENTANSETAEPVRVNTAKKDNAATKDNTAKENNAATAVSTPTLRPKVGGGGAPTLQVVGGMRQEKLLQIIRQSTSGKLQFKDLIAEFPGISDRTLRYDLKSLSDEGKLIRQGTGGPSNFYTLK